MARLFHSLHHTHHHVVFIVTINSTSSAQSSLGQGVPQGSVLGPLLFILYTTPLSSLKSDSSVSHHMYADDNQLFISFITSEFSANILHRQETVDHVSHQFHSKLKAFLILFDQSFPPSMLHYLLSVLWPLGLASGLHLIVIFTMSFILTSFIYASVCE